MRLAELAATRSSKKIQMCEPSPDRERSSAAGMPSDLAASTVRERIKQRSGTVEVAGEEEAGVVGCEWVQACRDFAGEVTRCLVIGPGKELWSCGGTFAPATLRRGTPALLACAGLLPAQCIDVISSAEK
jgi:hypothetical protein